MIRGLVIVAVIGMVLSVACCSAATALAGYSGWRPWQWDIFDDRLDDAQLATGEDAEEIVDEAAWRGGTRLELRVPAEVTYVQDPAGTIRLEGPAGLVRRVEIDGGEITMGRGYRGRNGLRITIRAPEVDRFELAGAFTLRIEDYDRDDLFIESSGAGDITASGRAGAVRVDLRGAGDVDLSGLKTDEARLEIAGAGNVVVGESEEVDVEIRGFGDVTLTHPPRVLNRDIRGFGDINRRYVRNSAEARDETADNP